MPFPIYAVVSMAIAAATAAATALLARQQRLAAVAAVAGATALVLFHGLAFFRFPSLADDAFITLRYSQHLADGLGPNWNSTGRVEGYTSFLWMGTLAGFAKLGADLVVTARVLDALAVIATFGAVYGIWKLWADENPGSGIEHPVVLAAALLGIALNDGVGYWGFSGIETPVFMALLTGSAYLFLRERRTGGVPWSAVAFAATAMTRPEGLIAVAVTGAFVAYGALRAEDRRAALVQTAAWGGLFLLLYGPYFLWRYDYYGYLFPNTYYAKVGATTALYNRGLAYITVFGVRYQLLGLFTGALLLIMHDRLRRDAAYVITLCAAMLLGVVVEGGDQFPHSRMVVPLLPLLYIAGLAGFASALQRLALGPARTAVFTAAALSLAGLSLLPHSAGPTMTLERRVQTSRALVGAWIDDNAPRNFTVGAFAVGSISYYSNRDVLDLLGLNDVTIAHTDIEDFGTRPAGHEKYNIDYTLNEVRPDVIVATTEAEPDPMTKEALELQAATSAGISRAYVALFTDARLWDSYSIRWLYLRGRWFTLLQRKETLGELHGPGLVREQNLLSDANNTPLWQADGSAITAEEGNLRVSSGEANYGASYVTSGLQLREGQTYVALILVQSTPTSHGDRATVSVRENGDASAEAESSDVITLTRDWQLVAVPHTVRGGDVNYLTIQVTTANSDGEQDAFLVRDAELRLLES